MTSVKHTLEWKPISEFPTGGEFNEYNQLEVLLLIQIGNRYDIVRGIYDEDLKEFMQSDDDSFFFEITGIAYPCHYWAALPDTDLLLKALKDSPL